MKFISSCLKITEYVCLSGTIFGTIAVNEGKPLNYVTIPLTASLALNTLNRQNFSRKIERTLKQIEHKIFNLDTVTQNLLEQQKTTISSLENSNQQVTNRFNSFEAELETQAAYLRNAQQELQFQIEQSSQDILSYVEERFQSPIAQLKRDVNELQNLPKLQFQQLSDDGITQLANKIKAWEQFFSLTSTLAEIERTDWAITQLQEMRTAAIDEQFKELSMQLEAVRNSLNDSSNKIEVLNQRTKPLKNIDNFVNKNDLNEYSQQVLNQFLQLSRDFIPDYELEPICDRSQSREVLRESLEVAQKRLLFVCPWIRSQAISDFFIDSCQKFLKQGGIIEIGWGNFKDIYNYLNKNKSISIKSQLDLIRTNRLINRQDFLSFISSQKEAGMYNGIQLLSELEKQYPSQFKMKLLGTHEKYLVCDQIFAMVGSHNYLTSNENGSEREIGLKTSHSGIIKALIERFEQAPNLEV